MGHCQSIPSNFHYVIDYDARVIDVRFLHSN
jgi:hypothetical protein